MLPTIIYAIAAVTIHYLYGQHVRTIWFFAGNDDTDEFVYEKIGNGLNPSRNIIQAVFFLVDILAV